MRDCLEEPIDSVRFNLASGAVEANEVEGMGGPGSETRAYETLAAASFFASNSACLWKTLMSSLPWMMRVGGAPAPASKAALALS